MHSPTGLMIIVAFVLKPPEAEIDRESVLYPKDASFSGRFRGGGRDGMLTRSVELRSQASVG